MCDVIRYCDPYQGFTTKESIFHDGGNGPSKDDFRGIFRGLFMTETIIGVDGRREIGNAVCWHVHTQPELKRRITSSGDCENPSVDRESVSPAVVTDPAPATHVPWIDYHVGMWKYHIYTVDSALSNEYDSHVCVMRQRLAALLEDCVAASRWRCVAFGVGVLAVL